jgi:hypothetical protein
MMRRWLMLLSCVIALAACAGAPPPGAGAPQPGVTALFPPGRVAGVIRVDVLDPLPLRAAALVAPDGTLTQASWLDVAANPEQLAGTTSLNDPWRPSILGANGFNPLPTGVMDPAPHARNQVLLTVSTADLNVPDPVAYQRDWEHYRIRLGFAASGDQLETRDIPAPAPPPEKTGG